MELWAGEKEKIFKGISPNHLDRPQILERMKLNSLAFFVNRVAARTPSERGEI